MSRREQPKRLPPSSPRLRTGERLFLAAYAASGFAGLVYQVAWTRLLALYMGHTTAATSTVVGAFMAGLGAGALAGAWVAPRLRRHQALYAYVALESVVAIIALCLPFALRAIVPTLSAAYADGSPTGIFWLVRLAVCFTLLIIPATALGATFPIAIRWFVTDPDRIGNLGGGLYAANTAGAAIGALATGFLLIPSLGLARATWVGAVASGVAVAAVLFMARRRATWWPDDPDEADAPPRDARRPPQLSTEPGGWSSGVSQPWLAAVVLALTGFAALVFEIASIRAFAMIFGPTTYAFAATVGLLIAGLAVGGAVGARIAGRVRRVEWVVLTLCAAAMAADWACRMTGADVPRRVAQQMAGGLPDPGQQLIWQISLIALLVFPTAVCFGVTFPLVLNMGVGRGRPVSTGGGWLYAVNTFASVGGSIAAGFWLIPSFGLQTTLRVVAGVMVLAAAVVLVRGRLSLTARALGLVPTGVALGMMLLSPPWDQELLASGVYKYAHRVPRDVDLESALKAGTLLYYREGASATVSVKQLSGTISLSIDGKVDASSTGDMLTQRLLAHLPLLLHPGPRDVAIIGLGSGVTLGSALAHPIRAADVIEISPEVVAASRYFELYNRQALEDPRTRLILGDGRSHLLLTARKYDVIISEPSNPWIAGVAALFTREFFEAVRGHLTPGGIICQWVHVYDMSQEDLRSVLATFTAVFPNASMWLLGDGDLLLTASGDSRGPDLRNIAAHWVRPGIAADLADVGVADPFVILSLFVGGPEQIRGYSNGATLQTDDGMQLEFSGPRALNREGTDKASVLRSLLDDGGRPEVIARALATATAAEWSGRGAMLMKVGTYVSAYDDYATALRRDPANASALEGIVPAAVASGRIDHGLQLLAGLIAADPNATAPRLARSRLLAATGDFDEALAAARDADRIAPEDPVVLEHLASLFADAGSAMALAPLVEKLQQRYPDRPGTMYYAAAWHLLTGDFSGAREFANRTIALEPKRAPAHNLLGAAYANLGESQLAKQAFRNALELNPRDSSAYANLGLLALSENRAEAARRFVEALLLDPGSAAARQGLAQAQLPEPGSNR